MGVTQLWQILAPVEQHRALSSLSGQTLAVDLSIWVCENQCVKQMQGVVSKPYLRNLFFRISHLTQLGVKLVFVIEGAAPELKWDTMIKRQQSRFPGRQGKQAPQRPAGKQTRRNFNSWLKECCELLEILGIPYIQSKGEAEALCALLNANGLVDGCLTNDGDAFLYGATTVYRNFTMNSKDPHVEMYRLSDIQSKLGIDRGGLVALGLLIGCDFVPKGVPGIGIANAVRLLQSLQGQDVLIRLQSWSTMSEKECVDQTEILARRKAIQVPDFPQIKVIDEFLCAKDRCPSRLPEWKRPVPAKLQEFSQIKLEWPLEYTIEKVLPLITLWDMQDLSQSKNPSVHQHLKPHRIVKTRIRQGEPCYEVEWIKPVTDTVTEGSYYVTIESQELFTKCYPAVVKAFITQSIESKKKPKAKKKKKKEESVKPPSLDHLSFQFEKVNLGKVTSKLQDSVKDLHPSFSEYDETTLTTKAKQPRHLTLSPNGKKSVNKGESSESRKPVSVPFSMSDETVAQSEKELENSSFVPLSQRVKLRMQNKHGSNKENEDKKEKIVKSVINDEKFSVMKSPGADLSNMSSLLEDIQNLSLKEADKFRHKMKEKPGLGSYSMLQQENSPQVMSVRQTTPMGISSRKMSTMKDFQKMSSPSTEEICTPMTYMKHKGALGDSFEIQKSPYYIENPFAPDKSKSEKNVIDISSPGFFSRPEPKKEPEEVDTRCAAEKLIEKIESGINRVGTVEKVHLGQEPSSQSQKKVLPKNGSGEDKFTVESLMSILNSSSSGKSLATPTQQQGKQKTSTPGNQSAFGLETSLGQFGDFQIQHSLLDSLCSGLVQALTPKGVSMTKDEYDKLLNTLNAMDSEDEEDDLVENGMNENNAAYEGIKCNIDFSELEKASTGFKNLNQKLLLKPIQIDDEDVMAKLSKSARKKLRRRERKREQEIESIAQMKNVSKSKGKTKNMTPEQSSRRNSVKSNNSDSSSLDKKMDKRKNKKENGDQNILQTKCEKKFKLDTQCVNKTNVKNNDNSPSINLSRNKNLLPDNDHKTFENPPEVTEENNQMLKKKKKKKKVKKASPVIDISADDSILDDKKVSSCAEYLRKALENNQRKSSENKIIKASPFMDVSADDTLLELEGLSCKVVGDDLDSDLEIKLKKKKRLSKEKLCSKYGISQTCSLDKEPVLSINDMLKNETDRAESVNSESCKCEGNLEQNSDGIEKVIDNCEKFDELSEKVIKVEDTVEKDLCQVRSPPENELNDALNVQSSKEFDPNEIEIDGNSVKNEIQVNSSAANKLIRDLKYFDDAEDSLGKINDTDVTEISDNIQENRVDFQVSANVVDNGGANKEELKHEKVNIGNSRKSKEDKDRDDDSDGSENIVNDLETWNGYDKDNSVMHNVVLENLDTDKTGDKRNDAMGSVGDEDDIVEGIEIANDFVALNTYHENGNDLHDVDVEWATSDDVNIERVIDASNDVVLNGKENANCVTDIASAADINNKCNGVDNEYEAKYGTFVGKMESKSNVEVDVRSESDTAALCIIKDVKDLHKVKVEMNDLTALGTGLSVSDHMNENGACENGRVEENVQHIINLKSDVNGVDRKQTFSSDSSDDEVEIKNLNGEFKEEFTKEFEVEQFNQLTSSIENFGENDTSYPEVFQSPACLADRLKLRLRKTSTKNVLDAFTNGK